MKDDATVTSSPIPQARAASARLGPAGRRVLAFIERHPVEALASSAAELATRASTSNATVVRTVQALGFTGLADLRKALVRSCGASATPADAMRRTLAEMTHGAEAAIDTVLRAHEEALAVLGAEDTRMRITGATLLLDRAARIVVFGIGPSAGLASYAATLLRRAGRRSSVLDCTGGMLADQLLDLGPGDALLLLAYGRIYREVRVVVATAKELGLPIVLVTESAAGKLVPMADRVVAVPRGRPGHVALHGATVVALEALMLALAAVASDLSVRSLDRLTALRRDLGG